MPSLCAEERSDVATDQQGSITISDTEAYSVELAIIRIEDLSAFLPQVVGVANAANNFHADQGLVLPIIGALAAVRFFFRGISG